MQRYVKISKQSVKNVRSFKILNKQTFTFLFIYIYIILFNRLPEDEPSGSKLVEDIDVEN
jgi:hypothetical protein